MKYFLVVMTLISTIASAQTVRLATFNVSMEADNYLERGVTPTGNELFEHLETGKQSQIRNIAEIIQRIRPEILLLNEFDYTPDLNKGIGAFQNNYLAKSQQGQKPIQFPYVYVAPVNTGVDSGLDLSGDGKATGSGGDAFGFGKYSGQYAMALLSMYPIDEKAIRTFQYFLWKDMPGNGLAKIKTPEGKHWYSDEARQILRLSSKSHWDIPVIVNGQKLHILASHPTPPVFDGPEDRNGHRNHDEIRFWNDYLGDKKNAAYIYDDNKVSGGFRGTHFAVMGDLNASVDEGDARREAIVALLNHEKVTKGINPASEGGKAHSADNPLGAFHTAAWRMRADYVLPSASVKVKGSGVFWPAPDSELERLVKDRSASSDHRLVWVDIEL